MKKMKYFTKAILIIDKTKYNDPLYRTIDHIVSIKEGFEKYIDYKIIENINNLCICSRSINCSKKHTKLKGFKNDQ